MHDPVKAALSWALTCTLMAGCQCARHEDSSRFTIIPGVGIADVLEVGMTIEEIGERTKDLASQRIKNSTAWLVCVPSLGAFWEQERKDQAVPGITFFVAGTPVGAVPGHVRISRFRGRLEGGLSFDLDGGVSRDDAVRVFGEPQHTLRVETIGQQDWTAIRKWAADGESYTWQNPNWPTTEVITYPGVSMTLESNRVTRLNVFHWRQALSKEGSRNGTVTP